MKSALFGTAVLMGVALCATGASAQNNGGGGGNTGSGLSLSPQYTGNDRTGGVRSGAPRSFYVDGSIDQPVPMGNPAMRYRDPYGRVVRY